MRHVNFFTALLITFILSTLPATCQPATNNTSDNVPISGYKFDELVFPSALQDIENAYDRAREWSPDAILISVNVVVPPVGQVGFVQFSFISKTNPKEYLLLSYKEGNVTTRISEWNASYSSFKEIELDQWLIDSTEAFKIAQLNGGQEHMSNASGNIDIGLLLQVAKNNTLVWRVSYRSLDGNGTMYIGVDAEMGKFMWIDLP